MSAQVLPPKVEHTTKTKAQITMESEPKVKAFVVMPFSKEYDALFSTIRHAATEAGVEIIRADEIIQPGPIINQIFDNISTADLVVAEVGSKNANVYYEIALAHCVEKPSILIAARDKLDSIPFDIRHNRIIPFDFSHLSELGQALTKSFTYLKEIIMGKVRPSLEDHLNELGLPKKQDGAALQDLISLIGSEFHFENPRLDEWVALPDGGYSVRIKDAYEERAQFTIDVNGNIRRKKRL